MTWAIIRNPSRVNYDLKLIICNKCLDFEIESFFSHNNLVFKIDPQVICIDKMIMITSRTHHIVLIGVV